MRKTTLTLAFFICCCMNTFSQEVIKLWDKAPLAPDQQEHIAEENRTTDLSVTELHIYKATNNPTGKAVIICPGGGYSRLAMDHEGKQVAEWMTQRGISAFVLTYRMPDKRKYVPLSDAQQAIRYVRDNAEKLGIDKNKIGIVGFSAGGHLASTASTHYAATGTSTRPDFAILFYPVVTMGEGTHGGSKRNLLGEKPSATDIYTFSNENQVTVNTPTTILLLSDDDKSVVPANSINYYKALKNNNIPAAMYIFPEGGHGWGFRQNFKYHNEMSSLLEKWLTDLQ